MKRFLKALVDIEPRTEVPSASCMITKSFDLGPFLEL